MRGRTICSFLLMSTAAMASASLVPAAGYEIGKPIIDVGAMVAAISARIGQYAVVDAEDYLLAEGAETLCQLGPYAFEVNGFGEDVTAGLEAEGLLSVAEGDFLFLALEDGQVVHNQTVPANAGDLRPWSFHASQQVCAPKDAADILLIKQETFTQFGLVAR